MYLRSRDGNLSLVGVVVLVSMESCCSCSYGDDPGKNYYLTLLRNKCSEVELDGEIEVE